MLELPYAEGWSCDWLAEHVQMTENGVKAAPRRVRADLAACIGRRVESG